MQSCSILNTNAPQERPITSSSPRSAPSITVSGPSSHGGCLQSAREAPNGPNTGGCRADENVATLFPTVRLRPQTRDPTPKYHTVVSEILRGRGQRTPSPGG